MADDSPLERFRKAVQPFLTESRTFEFRALGVRDDAGIWHLNSFQGVLHATRNPKPPSAAVSVDGVLALHGQGDGALFEETIRNLTKGAVRTDSVEVGLRGRNGREPDLGFSFYRHRAVAWSRPEKFGSAISLEGTPSGADLVSHEVFDRLDADLRASDPPWDGVEDLRQNFVGVPEQLARSPWQPHLAIHVPLGVTLRDVQLQERRLRIRISRLDSVNPSDCLAGVIANFEDGPTQRTSLVLDQVDVVHEFDRSPAFVTVMGSYKKNEFGRRAVGTFLAARGNPRASAFRALTGGPGPLEGGDIPQKGKFEAFELWVLNYWTQLGLSPLWFGALPGEHCDLLVFEPRNAWCLMVECTTVQPDHNEKISKLSHRARQLEKEIGVNVIPVVATSLGRRDVNQSDVDKCAAEDVALMTFEAFESLAQAVRQSDDLSPIREHIEALMPAERQASDGSSRLRRLRVGP